MTLQNFTNSPYNLEYFKDFIQEAFPQAQLLNSPTTPYKDGHIIHAYAPICQDIELESSNILQVFAFEVGSTHAKITLHKELAKIAKNNASHILACFYDPSDTKEFRLSLITTGFDFEANKTTHSNLRRQSFVLGDSIPTHTAQKQLKALIDSTSKDKQTLESAFSLQAVTDEFYVEYKKLYDDLCQVLNAHQAAINALNGYQGVSGKLAISAFVKKLLGRIIFLYFLQKKGWLGVEQGKQWGSGDKHFFRSLFERAKAQGESFYTKLLCPLFFESLNTERKDNYSQDLGCKIPFLNGGLFEEAKLPATEHHSFDRHIAIEQALDNTQFAKIFDLFDRYHFTIEESTPDNVEISIDPEMLGKVFENLIDYNKDTGAFYTRRPIVHFMCKNALTRYLQIQLLGSIAQADLSDSSAKVDCHALPNDNARNDNALSPSLRGSGDSHNEAIHKKQADSSEVAQAIQSFIFHQEIAPYIKQHKEAILTLLQECKILDNAIGSGAFPMGLLLEILEAIRALCPELEEEQLAAHKRQIIANQIYGVDIDGDAIEIAKLRFWLSIAVDESSPSPLPNLDFKLMQGNSLLESICGIPVLPRLASHLEQPQTLMDTNEQLKRDYGKPQERALLDSTTAQKLEAIFLDYYESHTPEKKQALKQEILRILRQATDKEIAYKQDQIDKLLKNATPKTLPKAQAKAQAQSLALENFKAELDSLLQDYAHYDFHTDKLFLYRFFFAPVFEKGGFDIVIGNPPYIRQENIPQKQEILQEFEALRLEPQAPIKFSNSSADIFTYFYAKGLELLKPSGVLSFITSNKWCRAKYGQNLRELLLPRLDSHYDLNGIKAFESATVDTAITTALKSQPKPTESKESKAPNHNLYFLALGQSGASHQALLSSSPYLSTTIHTKRAALPASSLSASSLSFASPAALALKAKIEAIGTPLKEWDISINYGIKTGYNEAFIIDSAKRDEILRNCVSENERQRTSELIKPILRGRDIKRYSYEWAGLWIINTHNGYTISDSSLTQSLQELQQNASVITAKVTPSHFASQPTNLTQDTRIAKNTESSHCETSAGSRGNPQTTKIKIPPIDINDYPALKAHLDTHWDKIAKRTDKGETPYNLRNCAYLEEFAKEKIVYSEIVREPQFYLDSGEFKFGNFYAEATSFILSGNENFTHSLHYLLGILHSKLITYAFKEFYAGGGLGESGYRYKKAFLERLPIPKVDSKIEVEFIQIVQEILEKKKVDSSVEAMDCHDLPCKSRNDSKTTDTAELESKLDNLVYALYNLTSDEIKLIAERERYAIALLLIAAIDSRLPKLTKLLIENFEKELCEAFRFCDGLKLPQREYQGKIIYPNMAKEFIAHLDTQGFFTNQKCFILTDKNGENLHYLTAILNSKANFWYFKQIGATLGASGYEMSKIFVEKLPIPKAQNPKLLATIEQKVCEILKSKKQTKSPTQSRAEKELDSLIYQLYDLDKAEIALIESSFQERERETCDS
ncbi:hypothetical protein HMPREF2087_01468 [Helicobacter canis NCTC 12740]|uniref:site-specific DNA-methyltransferase (adenine-specific) n=2 Tax=Helicobacter canis TaxID=29419 RepID=V8CF48_9HELI|nr:TaqI-like C-terminal specificity domain-containing protein [Helicobacter canis]ETD25640.1 hypothetical protein HMPREF2087_01468 [Helicobacter canis NCTC 12740]